MHQLINTANHSIQLIPNKKYYFIDPLYASNIKEYLNELNYDNLDIDIKEKVFPYMDYPFTIEYIEKSTFSIDSISAINNPSTIGRQKYFVSETNIVLIVSEEIIIDFISNFDYNLLVDSQIELLNSDYWQSIINKFNAFSIGIIFPIDDFFKERNNYYEIR